MATQKWYKEPFQQVKWWLPILMIIIYFGVETLIQEISIQIINLQNPNLVNDQLASIIHLNTYPWYFLVLHTLWVIGFIWLLGNMGMKFFTGNPFVNMNLKVIAYGFLALVIVQQVMGMIMAYVIPESSVSLNQDILNQSAITMSSWKMVVVFAILPAIIEEILVRGLIMRYLIPKKPMIGIVLSSLIFMGMHLTTVPIHALLYFLMGIILAIIYWRTDKIENAIAVHFLNNLLAVMGMIYLM